MLIVVLHFLPLPLPAAATMPAYASSDEDIYAIFAPISPPFLSATKVVVGGCRRFTISPSLPMPPWPRFSPPDIAIFFYRLSFVTGLITLFH